MDNKQEAKLYKYDDDEYQKSIEKINWRTEMKPFTKCSINAVAMIKIVMHAHSGGDIEVMGQLQGKVVGRQI